MDNKTPSFFEIVVMVVIVIGQVLNIYASPLSMSLYGFLSFILAVAYFVFFLFKDGFKTTGAFFWYGLGIYLAYRAIIMLIYGVLPLAVIEQFLVFFMAYGCFQREHYIKYMKIFAVVAIGLFIYQYYGYLTSGSRISGIFTFLPLSNDLDVQRMLYSDRSSSFFSEPSHFAQFLLPLLVVELFHDKNKLHLIFAAIVFLVIVFLQSGTGYIGLIPVLIVLIPYYKKLNLKPFPKILLLLLIGGFLLWTLNFIISNEIGEYVNERSEELDVGLGAGSGFIRMWRGYFVYNEYGFLEKLFGVGNPETVLTYVHQSGMYLGIQAELYFNAVQDILLYTGIVGLVLFGVVIVHIWKGNTICGKAIILSLIAISLVEHIYFSNVMLVHLLLAESMKPRFMNRELITNKQRILTSA